jgi:hypothetical protein
MCNVLRFMIKLSKNNLLEVKFNTRIINFDANICEYACRIYCVSTSATHVALEITYIYHVYWNGWLTQQRLLTVRRLTSSIYVYENSCSAALAISQPRNVCLH